ncbi:hypothetical protein M214_4118, partial [Acinetobacter baumannii CI86]
GRTYPLLSFHLKVDVATGEPPVPHDLALAWSATFSKLRKSKPRYAEI